MTAISARLDRITRQSGYLVGYKPARTVRRWSVSSAKPFHLYAAKGDRWVFLAAFATADALEQNWRKRTHA